MINMNAEKSLAASIIIVFIAIYVWSIAYAPLNVKYGLPGVAALTIIIGLFTVYAFQTLVTKRVE